MDTKMESGDFGTNERGLPYAVMGVEELLQRAYIRLKTPRGSFRYQPELGSGLSLLTAGDTDAQALAYAQEALRTLPQLTAERAEYNAGPPREVAVWLRCGGAVHEVHIKWEGDADGGNL